VAIAEVVEAALDRYDVPSPAAGDGGSRPRSVDDVLDADATARRLADLVVAGREAVA
jgi:hypothetical protein